MKHTTFDALTRQAGKNAISRRAGLAAMLGAVVVAALGPPGTDARSKKRRRGGRRRGTVQVCFNGQQLTVSLNVIEAMLRVGAQIGKCGLPQGTEICEDARMACNPNVTSCGDGCSCILTGGGGSMCAFGRVFCFSQQSICNVDQDCIDRLGTGSACVPTFACSEPRCGGNGLGCVRPCPPAPTTS